MNSKTAKHLRAGLKSYGVNPRDVRYVSVPGLHRRRYDTCAVGAIRWFMLTVEGVPQSVRLALDTGRARYKIAKRLVRDGMAAHEGRRWQSERRGENGPQP